MALTDRTYAGLQASIADWLNRDDLTATIPDFIALAEADISRRLVLGGAPAFMVIRAAAEIDDEFETTPTDFMGAVSLRIEDSRVPLQFLSAEKIAEQKAINPSKSGDPVAFAVVGVEFQFWPAPASSMILDLIYIARIPSLNNSITSNWLLNLFPDVYLYGALIQSAPLLVEDDRLQMWQSLYTAAIASVCAAGKRTQQAPQMVTPITFNTP